MYFYFVEEKYCHRSGNRIERPEFLKAKNNLFVYRPCQKTVKRHTDFDRVADPTTSSAMVQPRPPMSSSNISNIESFHALAHLSEYTHTLDSLPLDLSRNFADLRELDAVLSSSMGVIIHKITALTEMIEQGKASKEERLWLLTEIAEEASRLKLGGEDKIRVACQAADNLKSNMVHLKMLATSVPGFDPAIANRKTAYPHVAARSFMPAMSLESGRRKRSGYSSLLVSAPDPSPAKKRRAPRDDDPDVSHVRSPKKDRTGTENNSRSRARARKCVHLVHFIPQHV
jgi:inhibitor of growth protein 3